MAKKTKVDFKALAERAAKRSDQTQTKTGGDFAPAAEGTSLARFVDYIEVGEQKQKAYQGKAKPPTSKVMLTFELLSSKWVKEIEVDGKKKTVADRITITIPLSLHKKAGFKKLFEKMRYGRDDIVHMAQMIGEGFKVTVTHNKVDDGPNKGKVYANITDEDGNYLVGPAVKKEENDEGEIIGTKKLKVPEPLSDMRMFLFDEPTPETWESLFIDGEKEVQDDKGKNKKVSKNWIQNMIIAAENFEGSPLQAMLEGSEELPDDPDELEGDSDEEVEEEVEEEAEEDEEDTEEDESDSDENADDSEDELDDSEELDEVEEAPKAKKAPAKEAAKATGKKSGTVKQKAATTKPSTTPAKKSTSTTAKAAKTKSPSKSAKNALVELGLDDEE